MSDLTFPNRDITKFREKLNAGGVRSNLFEVEIPNIPGGGQDVSDEIRFLVKAAEIPSSNIGNIPVPFRGRVLPIAGDRTFDPWTVTIINDDFKIRDKMERWSNFINELVLANGAVDPASYQRNGIVKQLGRSFLGDGKIPVLRQYNFIGIYPNVVSSIPLDYGATDQIEEFQVTFNYLYYTVGALNEDAKESGLTGPGSLN
tara:strand:- start:43 stop:648 length:606 start_codon:yes stop_codon:yes gene_type:complete